MLEEAQKQDSVNLHAKLDDTGCEQKHAGVAAAEQTAMEGKKTMVNPVRSGRGKNRAVKWADMLEEEEDGMTRGLKVQKMRNACCRGKARKRPEVLNGEKEAP